MMVLERLEISSDFVQNYAYEMSQFVTHREDAICHVEDAIGRIYSRLGLSAPLIIWTDNHFQARHLSWFISVFQKHADVAWRMRVIKTIQNNYRKMRPTPTVEKFWLFLDRLAQENLPQFGEALSERLFDEVRKKMATQLADCSEQAIGECRKQQIDGELDSLLSPFYASFARQLPVVERRFLMEERLYTSVDLHEMSHWSAASLSFLATYDCVQKCSAELYPRELKERLDDWMLLSRSAHSYSFSENIALVSSFPKVVSTDENYALHCDNGPAFVTRDDIEYYFWHGTLIEKELYEKRARLKPREIDAVRNVSVRGALIEIYGRDRYFRDSKLKKVQQDSSGILYIKTLKDEEPVALVRVSNSTAEPDGSFKTYLLRVPPSMKTAREAVAWTFGLDPDEYDPVFES